MKYLVVSIGVLGIIHSCIAIGLAIFLGLIWAGMGNAIIIFYSLFILIGSISFWRSEIGHWK